ncbi:hypothetical protein [Acinetobacter baumannii]|uniref:hypothetical protein n=1 Tax=Acinetobacter baumannii TaxID=470 RepID=UPI001D756A7B|nr:hypothetical protein [Acinetobacter baumannii]EHU2279233.1 hypothetical protein [Acinetobacter baumannii]
MLKNNLMQAGETKVRNLRIVIDADSPANEVLQTLEEIGYKFERPANLDNLKTVLVTGDEVTFSNTVINPDPELYEDITLVGLIKIKVRVWSDTSFPGQPT